MPVRTVVNRAYLRDVIWQVRTTLNELNEKAGLSAGYIYKLASKEDDQVPIDASLSTIDKLHNAIESLMLERDISPPDDLWSRLVIHEEV